MLFLISSHSKVQLKSIQHEKTAKYRISKKTTIELYVYQLRKNVCMFLNQKKLKEKYKKQGKWFSGECSIERSFCNICCCFYRCFQLHSLVCIFQCNPYIKCMYFTTCIILNTHNLQQRITWLVLNSKKLK